MCKKIDSNRKKICTYTHTTQQSTVKVKIHLQIVTIRSNIELKAIYKKKCTMYPLIHSIYKKEKKNDVPLYL